MGSMYLFTVPRNLISAGTRSAVYASPNCLQTCRAVSISACLMGKRNPRKFDLGNKRGTIMFRRNRNAGKYAEFPVEKFVQDTGFMYDEVYHDIPEMRPVIIAPDLEGCDLKPYVSYRTADIYQSEFTAQDLFDVVYRSKITKDFNEKKLDEEGNPLEPSEEEKLTPEEAWIRARKSGSDLFSERTPKLWECLETNIIDKPIPPMAYTSDDLTHPSETTRLGPAAIGIFTGDNVPINKSSQSPTPSKSEEEEEANIQEETNKKAQTQ